MQDLQPDTRHNGVGLKHAIATALPLMMLCSASVLADASETPVTTETQEVLVTATRLPRQINEVAGTVTLISADDIERALANDINDLTRYQPGISMETASRGGNQGFVIRGIGGNRVLTVLDGVRSADMYNAGPSSYGKDAFELDDVKAVEIIRGPASVLYGADAMGGAVLLRSKDAADYLRDGERHYLALRSAADSVNDLRKLGLTWATRGNTRAGELDTVLQLTQRHFSERKISGNAQLNPQDGETLGALIKTAWTVNPAHRLELTLDRREENVDSRILNELSTSVQESLAFDRSTRQRVSLRHEWQSDAILADTISTQLDHQQTDGQQVSMQLRTSFAFVNPRNPASFRGTAARRDSDFGFNQDTSQFSLILAKSMAQGTVTHDVVYGLHHELTHTERPRERCDTEISTGNLSCAIPSYPMAAPEVFPNKTFPDTRTQRSGVFVQDEIRLLDQRLSLIPGVRVDRYRMTPQPDALFNGYTSVESLSGFSIGNVSENNVSFNLGTLYQLSDAVNVLAQYAEGFRPANFDEANQAFVNAGHGYVIVPNTALQAETSKSLEAGLRFQNARYAASLTVYENRYNNFIESRTIGIRDGLSLFQDQNVGKANIHGAEASFDWSVSAQLSVHNALAWSHGEDEVTGAALDSIEPLTLVSAVRYAPSARWSLEAVLTAAASHNKVSAPDRVRGDSWQTIDFLGQVALADNLRVRFGIFNITDEQYARWSSIRGLAANDSTNLGKAQAPGTNARLSLDLRF